LMTTLGVFFVFFFARRVVFRRVLFGLTIG
jgi:hypothetical protein